MTVTALQPRLTSLSDVKVIPLYTSEQAALTATEAEAIELG